MTKKKTANKEWGQFMDYTLNKTPSKKYVEVESPNGSKKAFMDIINEQKQRNLGGDHL